MSNHWQEELREAKHELALWQEGCSKLETALAAVNARAEVAEVELARLRQVESDSMRNAAAYRVQFACASKREENYRQRALEAEAKLSQHEEQFTVLLASPCCDQHMQEIKALGWTKFAKREKEHGCHYCQIEQTEAQAGQLREALDSLVKLARPFTIGTHSSSGPWLRECDQCYMETSVNESAWDKHESDCNVVRLRAGIEMGNAALAAAPSKRYEKMQAVVDAAKALEKQERAQFAEFRDGAVNALTSQRVHTRYTELRAALAALEAKDAE